MSRVNKIVTPASLKHRFRLTVSIFIKICVRSNFEKLFYNTVLFWCIHINERSRSKVSMSKRIVFFYVFLTLASLSLALVPQVFSQPENIEVLSYS